MTDGVIKTGSHARTRARDRAPARPASLPSLPSAFAFTFAFKFTFTLAATFAFAFTFTFTFGIVWMFAEHMLIVDVTQHMRT